MNGEEWRRIPGWKHYEASNLGRVRSLDRVTGSGYGSSRTVRGRVLKQTVRTSRKRAAAWPVVALTEDGMQKKFPIGRLIAAAWLGLDLSDRNQLAFHISGDPFDNCLDNIAVGTAQDVADHVARRDATSHGEDRYNAVLSRHDVRTIIDLLAEGVWHKDIASRFGCHAGTIGRIARRETWRDVEYGHRFSRDAVCRDR
jgi:uncharacterized protein YerC